MRQNKIQMKVALSICNMYCIQYTVNVYTRHQKKISAASNEWIECKRFPIVFV